MRPRVLLFLVFLSATALAAPPKYEWVKVSSDSFDLGNKEIHNAAAYHAPGTREEPAALLKIVVTSDYPVDIAYVSLMKSMAVSRGEKIAAADLACRHDNLTQLTTICNWLYVDPAGPDKIMMVHDAGMASLLGALPAQTNHVSLTVYARKCTTCPVNSEDSAGPVTPFVPPSTPAGMAMLPVADATTTVVGAPGGTAPVISGTYLVPTGGMRALSESVTARSANQPYRIEISAALPVDVALIPAAWLQQFIAQPQLFDANLSRMRCVERAFTKATIKCSASPSDGPLVLVLVDKRDNMVGGFMAGVTAAMGSSKGTDNMNATNNVSVALYAQPTLAR